MRLRRRLLLLGVLCCLLFGLGVHYGAVEDERSPYPTTDELDADYGAYVGTETLVFGDVVAVDEAADRATIEVSTETGSFELTVAGFENAVQPGGTVQVYGVLRADRTVEATNVAVVNPAGSSNAYKYAVSAVGAVLVLVLFFSSWRFDAEDAGFEVRTDG